MIVKKPVQLIVFSCDFINNCVMIGGLYFPTQESRMKRFFMPLLVVSLLLPFPALAQKTPQTEREKTSYAIGIQIGQNISEQSFDLDVDSFVQAISDVLKQTDYKLSVDEIRALLTAYQQKQIQAQSDLAAANQAQGRKFLDENRTRQGVVALPSGLQYRIIREGTGGKPGPGDKVEAHYEGTLLDGTVFDSSYKRGKPETFPVNGVIRGWQEALQLMSVGSKWQVFIPSELGYGDQGVGNVIGPNSTLVFDIELISIQ